MFSEVLCESSPSPPGYAVVICSHCSAGWIAHEITIHHRKITQIASTLAFRNSLVHHIDTGAEDLHSDPGIPWQIMTDAATGSQAVHNAAEGMTLSDLAHPLEWCWRSIPQWNCRRCSPLCSERKGRRLKAWGMSLRQFEDTKKLACFVPHQWISVVPGRLKS